MNTEDMSVIDELTGWLGTADAIRLHGADQPCWVWTIDEDGDGVALARSATQSGLLEQVRHLLSADYGERVLGDLIVAPRMCGDRRFHERADLLEIGQCVQVGWCKWVAITHLERISRNAEAVELFADFLRETGTELIVTSHSRIEPYTFTSPVYELLARHAAAERRAIRQRYDGAKHRRRVASESDSTDQA